MRKLLAICVLLLSASAAMAQADKAPAVTKLPGEEKLSVRERAERDFLMPIRHKKMAEVAKATATEEDATAAPELDAPTAYAANLHPEEVAVVTHTEHHTAVRHYSHARSTRHHSASSHSSKSKRHAKAEKTSSHSSHKKAATHKTKSKTKKSTSSKHHETTKKKSGSHRKHRR